MPCLGNGSTINWYGLTCTTTVILAKIYGREKHNALLCKYTKLIIIIKSIPYPINDDTIRTMATASKCPS